MDFGMYSFMFSHCLINLSRKILHFDSKAKDGDLDLFLSPPDGRYFEQLADGSLYEWPVEQSPLVRGVNPAFFNTADPDLYGVSWHFVDCDSDGDFDLVFIPQARGFPSKIKEHNATHELQRGTGLCLGTNLSQYRGGAAAFNKNVFSVSNGQLKYFVHRAYPLGEVAGDSIEQWAPGFCMPTDPCHEKGICAFGQTHCSCIVGHKAADCSGCQQQYYHSARSQKLKAPDCKACPGDGQVCFGRGSCFDDVVAKGLEESTAAWMATGNGSCSCHEASFNGTDAESRNTCMNGNCPAGTEEKAGRCSLCLGGSFSIAGGLCAKCSAGKFSVDGSSTCSSCYPGRVAREPGNSSCAACPAGKHEMDKQFCALCPEGTTSEAGSSSCSPCDAGRFAKESVSCELCPGGSYAGRGSSRCLRCRVGSVSTPGSAVCRSCDGLLVRASSDEMNQTCQVDMLDIVWGLVCWLAAATFCFLSLTCLMGRLPISDISVQSEKLVITTAVAHYLLKQAHPSVSFTGTGVPALDAMAAWKVTVLSLYQLTLHGEQVSMPLDTSMGHLHLKLQHRLLSVGMWHCPVIVWCLFFVAVAAGAATQLKWSLALVAWGLGLCTGILAFALRRRHGNAH